MNSQYTVKEMLEDWKEGLGGDYDEDGKMIVESDEIQLSIIDYKIEEK
jgi:hypothetical protein